MSPTFHSLRIRNYRLYASGGVVSNVGTWMQRIGQDWLILELTGSGVALGITTGLQFLPLVLFGLVGGVLADRYPKRRLLVAANAAMATVALVLAALVLTGVATAWHVYVLAFALGLATAVENPTRQAFVVEMVGERDLPNAVALNSASFNAARIVGPALAGALIAWTGSTGPVFVLNALSYFAVIAALAAMRGRDLRPAPVVVRGKGQLREGLRYVAGRHDLVLVLVIVFFVGTFGLNFQMTTALMATNVFGKGAGEFGLLSAVMAVGSLGGALLAARRGAPRLRLLVLAAVVFGLLEMASGLMPSYELFAASLVPVGLSSLTLITAANATMQLRADPEMRGRVMALYMVVFFGGTPVGAPLVGAVAEHLGTRWSLVLGGAISALAAVVAAAVLMRADHIVLRAELRRRRPRLRIVTQELADTVQQA